MTLQIVVSLTDNSIGVIYDCIVKSGFGKVFQIFIFFQVIYKSYIQVLTSMENSSLFLKLRIFDKSRLATLYKMLNTKKYGTMNWFHLD